MSNRGRRFNKAGSTKVPFNATPQCNDSKIYDYISNTEINLIFLMKIVKVAWVER